ncbi:glycosyltransferase family 4 protein [Ornithinicoccus hortensis]|uniref:Glycosyltransferase involved in cell wall biosynthesis n=1 Tax=Ornithinicoccus hortensis TaxID=82346 RepID=A0A542YN21_9MICO|nr:glycosyltransferase family 4 protein [Ornithinicoccus hortensis]TQL49498.1 glycosyltransferase involved in cell wall biosynthesis [Ornithinicoccus hortensis]
MRIALCNWRDLAHPDGGGAEVYAQQVAAGLVAAGHHVTFLCAAHDRAPAEQTVDGVRYLRAGSRTTVYREARRAIRRLEAAEGAFDVVVDVQNGLPFFAGSATAAPVVVLVHHVHREQWPVVFNRAVAALGWAVESRVSPRVNRGRQYVAVSRSTKDELVAMGVERDHVAIIHNGTLAPRPVAEIPACPPHLLVLGRLVKHKRVEQAVDLTLRLQARHPGLRLRVVGDGWWRPEIERYVEEQGAQDCVDILGFVDEETKHRELGMASLLLVPSVKEGWGLSVVEAASHGVPAVGYRDAGGVAESIEHGRTGLLVGDLKEMVRQVDRLLGEPGTLDRLGANARVHAARFSWAETVRAWEELLLRASWGERPTAMGDHPAPSVPASPLDDVQDLA